MTRCHVISVVCLMLIAPSLLAQDNELLKNASAKRTSAEKSLADFRKQRLSEHKALNAELQSLYEKLADARENANDADKEKQRLKTILTSEEIEKGRVERRAEQLLDSAMLAADISAARKDKTLALQQSRIEEGLINRINTLKRDCTCRLSSEEVMCRDGSARKINLLHVGSALTLAAGEDDNTSGIVKRISDGKWQISGVSFTSDQREHLHNATLGKLELLPIDVEGSLVEESPARAWSITGWIESGGPFVWPILIIGLLGLLLTCERIFTLLVQKDAALVRVRAIADAIKGEPQEKRESKMESALLAEEPRLERSLTLIAAVAAIAPLLGLLGTVSGMNGTFNVISDKGTGDPRLLSGGISVALITTQLGLIVAVPMLLLHAWFSRVVERHQSELEQLANESIGEKQTKEESV